MPTAPRTRANVRASLHPLAAAGLIGAGLMLLLLVVGIAVLIVILKDSRDHIRAQDEKTAVLLKSLHAATPTARQVPPLINEVRPVVRALGRTVGPGGRALRATARAASSLPSLIRTTEDLARLGVPVLSSLGQVNLARILLAGGTVADALLSRDRLTTAIDATNRVLAELESENLIPVAADAARDTPPLIRRLLRVQLQTLTIQRASLRTQRTTLAIQRQALVHIESIDRKTGGTVPPTGTPVPTP
jgi:hypothetical protein